MSTSNNNTHFISLNVRGLRNKAKRHIVYNWIKKQKANICFLQETYVDNNLEKIMKKEWKGQVFNAFGSSHSRGVTILFDEKVNLNIEKKTYCR